MTTGLYAGILALLYAAMTINVVLRRRRLRALFGDANDPGLTRAIRIHGNFAEYVPFTLLLMFIYESNFGSLYIIHASGILLTAARIFHIYALHTGRLWARVLGTAGTQAIVLALALLLIVKAFTALPTL